MGWNAMCFSSRHVAGLLVKVGKEQKSYREGKKGKAMGCEHECFNNHRFEEIEKSIHDMQEKQSERHKEFYSRINKLEQKTALYSNDLDHIKETVDEMNNNLKILMAVPGKRYDTIIVCIITAVVGAVVGFMLSGVFPM